MNRGRVRRAGTRAVIASFALVVLAACGEQESLETELEDVTRVPTMSDAAAQATRDAPPPGATPEGATPEAGAGTPGAGASTPVGDGEPAAAATVEVISRDILFEPAEITIPADTDVTFVLPNEGVTAHNFAIDALGISVDLPPGATEEIVINAPAGEYEYYCNVPGHKASGMAGTLIVSEEAAAAPAVPAAGAAASSDATPVAQDAATAVATPATAPAATPEAAAESAAATEPVEVVSLDIYFEPEAVTIPADTDVPFVLPNEGVTAHNFSIDALGISIDQAPGETQETVITAPAGTYEYYCNVPGHKAAGMVGTLTVE